MSDLGIAAVVEQYIAWAEAKRGITKESKKAIRMRLGRFARWCEERGLERATEVTTQILEQYQRNLYHHRQRDGRPLRRKTQNLYLIEVRSLFRWLRKQRRILIDPAVDLELIQTEKVLPRHVLKVEEVELVLQSIELSHPAGLRDRAILEVLYSSGLRRAEVVKLKVNDLDMAGGAVMVRQGKGAKDRKVPIGERALAWVAKYLEECRPFWAPTKDDDGTLFLTPRRTPISLGTMTKIGRKRIEASGLYQAGDACHIFRHSAATLMLEGGADIRYIQQYLGHAQISTTQVYTRVAIDKLKEVHSRTHPSAKLGRKVPEEG